MCVCTNVCVNKYFFTVVECPSEDYLDSMLASPQLETHQNCSDTDLNKPALIVHMTPLQVYKREEYQSWMKK